MTDPVVTQLRDEITAIDREIFALVNRRLAAVSRLKLHKAEQGIDFVDSAREQQLLAERAAENDGPLSERGLRAFYAELLALTKRELSSGG